MKIQYFAYRLATACLLVVFSLTGFAQVNSPYDGLKDPTGKLF